VKLFIDECLSPDYAIRLGQLGHDAVHPLHIGRRGELDHTVAARCIAEDRAIVTENIGDFKELLGREAIHPGLIALPHGAKEEVWALLEMAIAFLEGEGGDPMDHLVNACLEFVDGRVMLTPLPRP
jgi:predicted nuclease of predicted toxin-antitoxin system